MNNFFVLTAEFWITILMVVGVLKYWRNKFQKDQLMKSVNKSYSLFLFSQLTTVLLIVFLGVDTQNYAYLKDLSIMGENAGGYWGYFSLELFTFVLTYIVVLLFSFMIYKISIPAQYIISIIRKVIPKQPKKVAANKQIFHTIISNFFHQSLFCFLLR